MKRSIFRNWIPFTFTAAIALLVFLSASTLCAQMYDEPDRGSPGDFMIQEYLRTAAEMIESNFLDNCKSEADWNRLRPQLRREYLDMLGLWPLPDKSPLHATITRTLDRGEYVVDMIHYQSRPGLYVTGNLYRPAKPRSGERLPAILYVCGHSPRGRNGNKTAYQSHGIWYARHGYICLTLDTIEMGELTCTHHGTYREGRWWWLSRGYTPAGVECWNGIRGIDYLVSRPDVDPERIGVSGISGGGAATTWISAADERVKASVPVSGWSDLVSHVAHRVVDGHCDCMFLYNTYQWPFALVPGLVAPRPLLFVNSDADAIFPMDGNERVINRLERIYSLMGAGDYVDSLVSLGGHAYRKDIRQASFRFMNTQLKSDPRTVSDSEVDLVTSAPNEVHPIPPESLRVFPQDSDFPKEAVNARIDYEFVPMARPVAPSAQDFRSWQTSLLADLRRVSFHHFPEQIPAAGAVATNGAILQLKTEQQIIVPLKQLKTGSRPHRVWLFVTGTGIDSPLPEWFKTCVADSDAVYIFEPRGIGSTRWSTKNPPNYVERSHYLLGRTADSGRVWDIAASAANLQAGAGEGKIYVAGEGAAGLLAVYAALLNPQIAGVALSKIPASHMEATAPLLLGVLRVCDVGDALGLLAPRSLTLQDVSPELGQKANAIYLAAHAAEALRIQP